MTGYSGSNITTIFWPIDVVLNDQNEKYIILGYKVNKNKLVVIDFIKKDDFKYINNKVDKDISKNLEIISCINFKSKKYQNKITGYDFVKKCPILNSNQILVYFKPPNSYKLEYYSLDPIIINIFWNNNSQTIEEEVFNKPTTDKYSDKMKFHWLEKFAKPETNDTKEVLKIINLTNYIRIRINSVNRKQNNKNRLNYLRSYIQPFITFLSFLYYFLIQKTCYIINRFLSFSLVSFKYKPYSLSERYGSENSNQKTKVSLISISYTFHQINLRLKQFYNLPFLYKKVKLSKIESEASIIKDSKFSPSEYIKFYNTVWLIINDILLGNILYTFIRLKHGTIVSQFNHLITVYESLIYSIINWLMNSPAGFKLNNELASFMGQLIFWVLELWRNTTLKWLVLNSNTALVIIENLTRYGGLSLCVAFMLDLNNLIFLNVFGFYIACTRLYCWQLNLIEALFKLFYGKKYNILRNRVDSNDYEFDQLMLGIIIFTIQVYLLPTVFIFYVTFVIARLFLLGISFVLRFFLISLNHFPIVVLLLKVKNKERLPAGITLTLDKSDEYFILKSRSLSLNEIYTSHMNSMINSNLFSLNCEGENGLEKNAYQISDVIDNWKRISIITLTKNVIFGNTIQDYDYKKMF